MLGNCEVKPRGCTVFPLGVLFVYWVGFINERYFVHWLLSYGCFHSALECWVRLEKLTALSLFSGYIEESLIGLRAHLPPMTVYGGFDSEMALQNLDGEADVGTAYYRDETEHEGEHKGEHEVGYCFHNAVVDIVIFWRLLEHGRVFTVVESYSLSYMDNSSVVTECGKVTLARIFDVWCVVGHIIRATETAAVGGNVYDLETKGAWW